MSQFVIRSYKEGFAALDTLMRALRYLAKQYSDRMTRDEAVSHFNARGILIGRYNALLDEMELEYTYGDGPATGGRQ